LQLTMLDAQVRFGTTPSASQSPNLRQTGIECKELLY